MVDRGRLVRADVEVAFPDPRIDDVQLAKERSDSTRP